MAIRVMARNRAFMGRVNGDQFYRGVCDDASEANLDYYRRQGYFIGDAVDLPTAVPPSEDQILDAASAAVKELEEQGPADTPAAPKRNAPRAVWASFLTEQGLDAAEDASRDDLIQIWEQSQA